MFQQSRGKMGMVFGQPFKKPNRHFADPGYFPGRKRKFSLAVGQSGQNFYLHAAFPKFFAQFGYRHGRTAINYGRFVGSGDLDNFHPARFKIRKKNIKRAISNMVI